MKHVTIYTDGACRGNPGRGGWGVVILYNQHRKQLSGYALQTTNNRMELTAAVEALTALREPCQVTLYTDSQYVQMGISVWLARWKQSGWKTTNKKKPVKNMDLWQALEVAATPHHITWHWIKGHAGHDGNELADQLANKAIDQLEKQGKTS